MEEANSFGVGKIALKISRCELSKLEVSIIIL